MELELSERQRASKRGSQAFNREVSECRLECERCRSARSSGKESKGGPRRVVQMYYSIYLYTVHIFDTRSCSPCSAEHLRSSRLSKGCFGPPLLRQYSVTTAMSQNNASRLLFVKNIAHKTKGDDLWFAFLASAVSSA